MKKLLSFVLAVIFTASILTGLYPIIETHAETAYNFLFPVNNGGKIAYVYGYS